MKLPPHLFVLRASVDDAEKPGPVWNQLLPVNVTKHRSDMPGGAWTVTPEICRELVANYAAIGKPRIAGNYFHQSEYDKALPIDSRVKPGAIVELEFREGLGLFGLIEWTDRGRTHVRSGDIDCISIEMAWKYRDVNSGKLLGPTLTGFALLNDPLFKEMPRAAASAELSTQADEAATTEAKMIRTKLVALFAALKLNAETATEEELTAAVLEREGKLNASASETTSLKAAASAAESTATSLRAQLDAKSTEVTTLKAQLEETKSAGEKALKAAATDKFKAGLMAKGIAVPLVNELVELHASDAARAEKLAALQVPAVTTKAEGIDSDGSQMDLVAAQKAFNAEVDKLMAANTKLDVVDASRMVTKAHPKLAAQAFAPHINPESRA